MSERTTFSILPQPDDSTCGPTCLHAVYRFFGDAVELPEVISEVPMLAEGGTLGVFLGCHALERGYDATIYTYNLQMFDPTWFASDRTDLRAKLLAQQEAKADEKLGYATDGYMRFLDLGGRIRYADLTTRLIRRYLDARVPILTGLSATYLHRAPREFGPKNDEDDIRGEPTGHFVVLCGYDHATREVLVADPLSPNPIAPEPVYMASIERVVCAVLLGIVTYDANLLIVRPRQSEDHVRPDRRQ